MSSTTTITLSGPQKYIVLFVLLFGVVLMAYLNKAFSLSVMWPFLGSGIVAAFAFIAHDLEDAHSPLNFPSWLTFTGITVASALFYAVASFDNSGSMKLAAVVSWLIVSLGYILHTLIEDKGIQMPQNEEVWVTAILGIAISLLVWWEANSTAGIEAFVATLVFVVPEYVHISFDGSNISATPVVNPPDPTKKE